jgi:gamma-tubulin complex component 6
VLRLATASSSHATGCRLLHLSKVLAKLGNQIHFLARVCKVDDDDDELDTGVQLICYLLDRTQHINAKDLYFVLVSVLRVSAEPYFHFLQRWMFSGLCHDHFEEFGLRFNSTLLHARSRVFWTSAHSMTSPLNRDLCFGGIGGGVDFIGDVQNLVYVCGKSLNLLRLCQPNHHLCKVVVEKQPKIRLLVTPLEQTRLKSACTEYVTHMRLISERNTSSLVSRKEAETEEKKEVLRAATRRHKEQLNKLRENRKSRIEQVERRKQIVFEDLRLEICMIRHFIVF